MGSNIDLSTSQNTLKDANVFQGYYSISRGTLLSRDTCADRDTIDNDIPHQRRENYTSISSIQVLRHSCNRFKRWLNRLHLRERSRSIMSSGIDAESNTSEHAGASVIATAGTTAAIDTGEMSIGVKIGCDDNLEHTEIKKSKIMGFSTNSSCSDTQIDQPSTDLEESESLRWRYSNKFHTLKDWIHRTLTKTRNPNSIHFQHGTVISDLNFGPELQTDAASKHQTLNSLTHKLKSKPQNLQTVEHDLLPVSRENSNSNQASITTMTDHNGASTPPEQKQDTSGENTDRLRNNFTRSLRYTTAHSQSIASFNNIGHIGDISIKDDEEEGDLYIRLKDIGLSPTNEFYRELYAICNI